MNLLAAAGVGSLFFVLLVFACPLIMFLMMRTGMHGGQSQHGSPRRSEMTLDELKHDRDELNELIAQRARDAADSKAARA